MDENVGGLFIALDEAKTFLAVEEFDDTFAGADNLCRHSRATRGTAKAAATKTAAATITAAKATAAKTPTTSTAAFVSTAYFTGEGRDFTKTIVAKTITLVTAAATTLVIETHVRTDTFSSPTKLYPCRIGRFPCISRGFPQTPQPVDIA
jgi:hypothetical protein